MIGRKIRGIVVSVLLLPMAFAQPNQTCTRIVSISPSITDTLATLNLLPNTVGVTRYCIVPQDLKINQVGGIMDTNYEAVVTLNPSVIFIQGDTHTAQINALKRFNYSIKSFSFASIERMVDNIEKIGEICGVASEAAKIRLSIRDTLETLAKHKPEIPPRVLIFYGFKYDRTSQKPPVSAAGKSYHSELLTRLGGSNVYQGSSNAPQLSQEAVLHLNPDIIIILSGDGKRPSFEERYQLKTSRYTPDWKLLAEVNAVKNNKIFLIEGVSAMIPSAKAVESLAREFSYVLTQ